MAFDDIYQIAEEADVELWAVALVAMKLGEDVLKSLLTTYEGEDLHAIVEMNLAELAILDYDEGILIDTTDPRTLERKKSFLENLRVAAVELLRRELNRVEDERNPRNGRT